MAAMRSERMVHSNEVLVGANRTPMRTVARKMELQGS